MILASLARPLAALFLALGLPAGSAPSAGPHVLFVVGDDKDRTAETLAAFARQELAPIGLRGTFAPAALRNAKDVDLIVLAPRNRALTSDDADVVRAHLKARKPLIAIRGAARALSSWPRFDVEVLGADFDAECANPAGPSVTRAPHADRHPLLKGLPDSGFRGNGPLYRFGKLAPSAQVLFGGISTEQGQIVMQPVAWTRADDSRVFYTSLGHPDDFQIAAFRRVLVNAVHWALDRPVPVAPSVAAARAARDKFNLESAANPEVAAAIKAFEGRGETGDSSAPTAPDEAIKLFQLREGFDLDLLASEPAVEQPVHVSFDERGRMWVVQYRQYPLPAGLKVKKYDEWLRAVFDRTPEPPPQGTPGADKVTVLEDADGDGRYEKVKDVITGLNITTAVAIGRGGIWVLNPPYLLFYADRDHDDRTDGDPEVHLRGFGLEDTHSTANSLRWGPDGWLYGANGSTTTGTVSSAVTKNLRFEGQNIWRYHPKTKVFEIFAEGGGNTYSLDFDAKGRAFSGTNYGETRGMHHVQGGYGVKHWGKHGPLTNPHAFGFYQHMRHKGYPERFPQAFLIYDGGSFPARYRHTVIAANALYNRVHVSDLLPDTSTFRTNDFELLAITPDRWFRPVDIEVGPDGAIYVADWYDTRLGHVDPRDNWHKASGRIYRIRAAGTKPVPRFDLGRESSAALLDVLKHPNEWFREEARRVLADRKDRAIVPGLRKMMAGEGQLALEALWALYVSGGFDGRAALQALEHADPHVRRWGSRLVGDARRAAAPVAARLAALARTEKDVEVRSQLASTAKRLPAATALPIVERLLRRREDLDDLHMPLLLWWALESKAVTDRPAVLALLRDRSLWSEPMVERHVLARLAKRYAMAGKHEDLITCARLLEQAPTAQAVAQLTQGLEEAFRGQPAAPFPAPLKRVLAARAADGGQASLLLGIRSGDGRARETALAAIADESAVEKTRLAYIEVVGEVSLPGAAPALLQAIRSRREPVRRAALAALGRYDSPDVGQALVGLVHAKAPEAQSIRPAAFGALASRKTWARLLLDEVATGRLKPVAVPSDVLHKIALHRDPDLENIVRKHWATVRSTPAADKQKRMDEIARVLRGGRGEVTQGKAVFQQLCAPCHTLFGEGGRVGPELTGYERTNLDFMLLATVDPNAGLREEYIAFVVTTKDGRTLTGFIEDQNPRTVTLKGIDGQQTVLSRAEIETLSASHQSVMPEGLLDVIDPQQIRHLFAYLMVAAP